MTTYQDPLHGTNMREACAYERQSLAFEVEFDGARRPQARTYDDPWDPDRYWDIFSGTD
jgi:hypothetical protein